MINKITAIKEKVPQEATLNDGTYIGTWGGHVIEVKTAGKVYELTTEEGVRGFGFAVVVTVEDGIATFAEVQNKSKW